MVGSMDLPTTWATNMPVDSDLHPPDADAHVGDLAQAAPLLVQVSLPHLVRRRQRRRELAVVQATDDPGDDAPDPGCKWEGGFTPDPDAAFRDQIDIDHRRDEVRGVALLLRAPE